MPNGVSCGYFAARNFVYGEKEDNIFKKGIGVIQTVRTIDAIAQKVPASTPLLGAKKTFLEHTAGALKECVYPLIIASGIRNTLKSDDKVKTGVSQASAISVMWGVEKLAEKKLESLEKNFTGKSKLTRAVWYVARGVMFIASSMLGYSAGNKAGELAVTQIRKNNAVPERQNTTIFTPINESEVFEDMDILKKDLQQDSQQHQQKSA